MRVAGRGLLFADPAWTSDPACLDPVAIQVAQPPESCRPTEADHRAAGGRTPDLRLLTS